MSALDGVLADLVESDRDCAYATVKREPLETLIQEWLSRGDQIALLCALVTRAQKELVAASRLSASEVSPPLRLKREALLREMNSKTDSTTLITHHRHAVRLELAATLKQALRSAVAEIHSHITEAMLKGNCELAERLESDRQTVQIVIGVIDVMVNRLFARDLAAGSHLHRQDAAPPA